LLFAVVMLSHVAGFVVTMLVPSLSVVVAVIDHV
jgi:hypothetical protein